METLLQPYRLIFDHRQLLWAAIKQAIRERYAGSALGMAWLVVGPLILLSLYAIIYAVIFQVKPVGLTIFDYILYIFSGLSPYIAFARSLGPGTTSLSSKRSLLLNRMFPAELIPAREVFSSGTFLLVGVSIILIMKLATGNFYWTWLLLPVFMVLLAMATIGFVWALSLANLVLKDVQEMTSYITIITLIVSPIAYTPDMIPAKLTILLYCNPFAYYVVSFQSLLVLGKLPPTWIILGCVGFALVSYHGMFRVFSTGKRIIADQI